MGDKNKKLIIITAIILITISSLIVLISIQQSNIKVYQEINSSSCETDDCFILSAIENSNPNYCKYVSNENISMCYSSTALKTRDYNLCDKSDSYTAQTCKIAISHDSKDMEACKKYSYKDTEENLMQGKPTKKLCDSVIYEAYMKINNEKETLVGMFMESNYSICEEYKNNPNIKNSQLDTLIETCYYEVAIANQNISYCNKTNKPLTYYCLGRASAE